MNINCGGCGRPNRFKGKKSEISRGGKIRCQYCQSTTMIQKKKNGGIVAKKCK